MTLVATDLIVNARSKTILDRVSLTLQPGELVALVGPNGAGKSTLFDTLAGLRVPTSGSVAIEGKDLSQWSAHALAKVRAVLPQRSQVPFGFTVTEIVMLGRLPFGARDEADVQATEAALAKVGALELADRVYATLSGGEQQRVQIARVLAQSSRSGPQPLGGLLLLDEPCASLDLAHARALYRVLRDEARRGASVLIVDHDLGRATLADRLIVMAAGRLVADGPPSILDGALLRQAFGIEAALVKLPSGGVALDISGG